MHEATEIAILCDQDPVLSLGKRCNLLIGNPGRDLGDRGDVVARLAEGANDGEVATLVGEEVHLLSGPEPPRARSSPAQPSGPPRRRGRLGCLRG